MPAAPLGINEFTILVRNELFHGEPTLYNYEADRSVAQS